MEPTSYDQQQQQQQQQQKQFSNAINITPLNTETLAGYNHHYLQQNYFNPVTESYLMPSSNLYDHQGYSKLNPGGQEVAVFSHQVSIVDSPRSLGGNALVKQERSMDGEVVIPVTLLRMLQNPDDDDDDDIKKYLTSDKKNKKKKGKSMTVRTTKVRVIILKISTCHVCKICDILVRMC